MRDGDTDPNPEPFGDDNTRIPEPDNDPFGDPVIRGTFESLLGYFDAKREHRDGDRDAPNDTGEYGE